MKTLLSVLGAIVVIITLVGVSDAYHNSFLEENCADIDDNTGNKACSDIQYLNSIILEQQEYMDIMNGTLINMNSTIDELILLHDPVEYMEFTVTTDKESYEGNEMMIISGTLPNEFTDSVLLNIIDENVGWPGWVKSISSNGSGEFSTGLTFNTDMTLESGTYTIKCTFQNETITTTFDYTPTK